MFRPRGTGVIPPADAILFQGLLKHMESSTPDSPPFRKWEVGAKALAIDFLMGRHEPDADTRNVFIPSIAITRRMNND